MDVFCVCVDLMYLKENWKTKMSWEGCVSISLTKGEYNLEHLPSKKLTINVKIIWIISVIFRRFIFSIVLLVKLVGTLLFESSFAHAHKAEKESRPRVDTVDHAKTYCPDFYQLCESYYSNEFQSKFNWHTRTNIHMKVCVCVKEEVSERVSEWVAKVSVMVSQLIG